MRSCRVRCRVRLLAPSRDKRAVIGRATLFGIETDSHWKNNELCIERRREETAAATMMEDTRTQGKEDEMLANRVVRGWVVVGVGSWAILGN